MGSYETILGLLAGALTTGAMLPQIIKTIRTRDTKSISLPMYIIYVIGVILWVAYALITQEPVLILTNIFSLVMGITMLIMKLKYK